MNINKYSMAQYKRKFQIDNNNSNLSKKSKYEDSKFKIINQVRSQAGIRGNLVLFDSSIELPFTILNNAVDKINGCLQVCKIVDSYNIEEGTYKFQLSVDNELLSQGSYTTEKIAKNCLAELALSDLKKTCFTVLRKIQPRSCPKIKIGLNCNSGNLATNSTVEGIGAKMMLQMGWSGKGLGAQEQGSTDIIEPYFQIQRQGLGMKNIAQEVRIILKNYASSKNINSIAFSSEFTKAERTVIHEVARKLHLVSKSYGSSSDRIVVVRSRIKPWDLVHSLLEAGGETEQLKLILPTDININV